LIIISKEGLMKISRNLKGELLFALLMGSSFCFADAFMEVPLCRQDKDYTCGVAALQCILAYYEYNPPRQDVIAKSVKANIRSGVEYSNIQKFAEDRGYDVQVKTGMTIGELKGMLDEGRPVILLIQAWHDPAFTDPVAQYATDYDDGHYVVAMGYNSDYIYFMDPSTLGNYTKIANSEFLSRWHDEEIKKNKVNKLDNFGMMIRQRYPGYEPDEIKKLK
jgi:predicted double-glycine peptidase